MKELYLSIIGAFIRFWDNRFNTARCRSCEFLQTEVARLQDINSGLVDRLLSPAPQPAEDILEATDARPEPRIRNGPVPWEVKRRELELAHRAPRENKTVAKSDLESLENDLAELSK